MFAILGVIGCLGVGVFWACIIVGGTAAVCTGAGVGVDAYFKGEQLDQAKAAAAAQRNFEDKQLRMHKADQTRQQVIQRQQLRRVRTQVMNSVSLNEVMADRATVQANRMRRDNASSGAGIDIKRGSMPRATHQYGKPV